MKKTRAEAIEIIDTIYPGFKNEALDTITDAALNRMADRVAPKIRDRVDMEKITKEMLEPLKDTPMFKKHFGDKMPTNMHDSAVDAFFEARIEAFKEKEKWRIAEEKKARLKWPTHPIYCERCSKKINAKKAVWLEFSATDGRYYITIPEWHESQGGFSFGAACAKSQLLETELLLETEQQIQP